MISENKIYLALSVGFLLQAIIQLITNRPIYPWIERNMLEDPVFYFMLFLICFVFYSLSKRGKI